MSGNASDDKDSGSEEETFPGEDELHAPGCERMWSLSDHAMEGPRWKTTLISGPGDVNWIKKLNRKECVNYFPRFKHNGICYCGRSRSEHVYSVDSTDSGKGFWHRQNSVVPQETDTFGRIVFEGDPLPSLFVRLDDKTSSEDLTYLMTNIMGVATNDLHIHFLDFEENDPSIDDTIVCKLRDKLTAGLRVLSEKTTVLLTSQGVMTGISALLHYILNHLRFNNHFKHNVISMAVCPWGIVDRKDIFKKHTPWEREDVLPGPRTQPDVLGECLSSSFSHYLFVDDGTYHCNIKHIQQFRRRLEHVFEKGPGSGAPSVLIMVNGGNNALNHVISALERNIPVIVVKGSGGYADEIVTRYLHRRPKFRKILDVEGHVSFKYHLASDEGMDDKDDVKLRHILSFYGLLTVLDPEPQTLGLDMVIVWALLKAKQEQKLHWLLESFLANSPGAIWQSSYSQNIEHMYLTARNPHTYFLVEAMFNNSAAVAESIMKGLDLKEHFTMDNIVQLYNRFEYLGPCRKYLKEAKEKNSKSSQVHKALIMPTDVRTALQDMLGPCYPLECTGLGCQCQMVHDSWQYETLLNDPDKFRSCLPPVQEMFLWALFTNKQKLALMLWNWCEDKLASALVGEVVLRQLAYGEENLDRETELLNNAKEFEDLAVGMLRKSFELDEEDSHSLLLMNTRWWAGKSCLQLAIQFQSSRFISQQACKSLLDKIWCGGIFAKKSVFKKYYYMLGLIPGVSLLLFQINKKERKGFSLSDTENQKSSRKKIVLFYTAPVIKYILNLMMFVSFLLFFSYVLLVDLQPKFTLLQGVVCVWVATFLGEELRQVFCVSKGSFQQKLTQYFRQGWNWLDVITIVGLFFGMILVVVPGDSAYQLRRVVLNVDIFLFAMRLLQMFVVRKNIGPMLTMIQRMISDTVSFMVILLVFVLSYGVVSHSILVPQADSGWRLLYDVPHQAYWQIYGEFFLDDIQNADTCHTNETSASSESCTAVSKYIVELMLAGYAIITHVLLLNILIAKFNYTFAEVQGEASQIWAWHRCQIIYEYYMRPWLPPPFNIIYFFYWILKRCLLKLISLFRQCCRKKPCCRRRKSETKDGSSIPLQTQGSNSHVYLGSVGASCVQILFNIRQLPNYNRYRVKYWAKGQDSRGLTITLCPTHACTVRDLAPLTAYQFEVVGGKEEKDGSCRGWDNLAFLETQTESDSDWEELSELEKNIATFYLTLPTTDNVILEKTEAISRELSNMMKSNNTSHQTSTGALEQLSKEVEQIRGLQVQHKQDISHGLKEIKHTCQEHDLKIKDLETSMKNIQENQQSILKILHNIENKIS